MVQNGKDSNTGEVKVVRKWGQAPIGIYANAPTDGIPMAARRVMKLKEEAARREEAAKARGGDGVASKEGAKYGAKYSGKDSTKWGGKGGAGFVGSEGRKGERGNWRGASGGSRQGSSIGSRSGSGYGFKGRGWSAGGRDNKWQGGSQMKFGGKQSTNWRTDKFGKKQMANLLVKALDKNVFLVFMMEYQGHVYKYSSSLNHYETMKGQKMTEHMLMSMMQKFVRDLSSKMSFVSVKRLSLNVVFQGSLWIRQPILKAISHSVGVSSYGDATGVPHNGVRPKARRRI